MTCTDEKHKIDVGESNFPLAAVPQGKQVLVACNEAFQVGDHNFSTISLIPTVTLINNIPESIEKSWYHGKACVGIKMTATNPLSALRNATEIVKVLINKYGSKEAVPPILILYMDGGPKHHTTFLSVKITLICLQKFLNLDQVLAVHTAPGHSYRNPAEKINCILNLGLYGIGSIRKHSTDPEFEQTLHNCLGLGDIRKLIEKNSECNTNLLKEICQPCIDLIPDNFSRLKLKDEPFEVYTPSAHEEINDLFATTELDENLKANDTKADLTQCPKLAQYLSHCARERTYFVSIKKCGSQECNICKPLRLNDHDFQRLDHIPDPTPDDAMHYKRFSEVFRTQTMKAAMPSSKTSKDCGSKVPFNVVKQHATNTGITIECGECSKPRLLSIS